MLENSQEKVAIRNYHISKLKEFEHEFRTGGKRKTYGYGSLAIKEEYERITENKAPKFDLEFELNPFLYQYDLELFIFLHYDQLHEREIKLLTGKKRDQVDEYGFTGFSRDEHLLNAISIRWPTKTNHEGTKIGACVRTPWLEDVCFSLANYSNTIVYGGAGQGKTFGSIVFMSMIFDYFYFYKSGAQCSYSSVSESKLIAAPWSFVNSLYPIDKSKIQFSSSAGLAKKSADFTFKRVGIDGKTIETGGMFKGILLAKGVGDSRVVDKLTGCHDPKARVYLLDEMQATSDAPINAHANMFMHPKHGWFVGSGNYELPNDLLGVNVEPNNGWDGVDEKTHMYEGTLKSTKESLGKKSNVIHFNNELSPAVVNPELAKVWPHLPNLDKKKKNYPSEDSMKTISYKRFWIGFRYKKEEANKEHILTSELLRDSGACNPPKFAFKPVRISSFDSAPASVDRNINNILEVGFEEGTNKIIIAPACLKAYPKPTSDLEYYQQTSTLIMEDAKKWDVMSGNSIMDWTNRTGLLEWLAREGFKCHHLIYNEGLPKRKGQVNKVNRQPEDLIELETIPTFVGRVERKVTRYAHEKILNRIALGAYLFRYFVEKGCVRGLNASILNGIPNHNGFEKEFLTRSFITTSGGLVSIDSKEKFKDEFNFSPDVLDTFFQAFYLLYVILKVHPGRNSLGSLKRETDKRLDRYKKASSINRKIMSF